MDNLDWDTIFCSSDHFTCAAPTLLYRYANACCLMIPVTHGITNIPALFLPANIIDVFVPLDQLGISAKSGAAMITAEFAALSGFTMLVTGLIATRLLLARRRHRKLMGMCPQ